MVCVDTLAVHAALSEGTPGVAIFTTIAPEQRIPAVSALHGLQIPGARGLPLWGRHKEDATWASHQAAYDAAWLTLDRLPVLRAVGAALALAGDPARAINLNS